MALSVTSGLKAMVWAGAIGALAASGPARGEGNAEKGETLAVERCAQVIDRCRPDPARHALYSELFAVYIQAQAALAPLDHKLHALFANQE